jgi:hypothetical protein
MRGRIFVSVLLGLSLVALPAFAHRHPRERNTREHPGRPDRPGQAMERSRPGDDSARVTSSSGSVTTRSQGQVNNARGIKLLGKAAASGKTGFNEAGEAQGMSKAAAQMAIAKAAASRGTGNGFAKVNNARGKSLLGRGAASARTAFNAAGEDQGMSKAAAQIVIFKAAHARAPGNGAFGKIGNAQGKSLIANRTMSMRSACNEAEECSLGNAGTKAVIFKAAHSRAPGRQERH